MAKVLAEIAGAIATLLGYDGADFRNVKVDTSGHLQVDVLSSAPLSNALQSVGVDRFRVRGENQLFSYQGALHSSYSTVISGNDGYSDSLSPGTGYVWVVTNVRAIDLTTLTTRHGYNVRSGTLSYGISKVLESIIAGDSSFYHGEVWLETGDKIRVAFKGGLINDQCMIDLTGYIMSKEA